MVASIQTSPASETNLAAGLSVGEVPSPAVLTLVDVDGGSTFARPRHGSGLLGLHARLETTLSLAPMELGVVDLPRIDLLPVHHAHVPLLTSGPDYSPAVSEGW